jgi:hypothetical protein
VGSVPLAYNATNPVSYTPRQEFYKNAHFFRFIPLGAVRIAATSSLDAVAFHQPALGAREKGVSARWCSRRHAR